MIADARLDPELRSVFNALRPDEPADVPVLRQRLADEVAAARASIHPDPHTFIEDRQLGNRPDAPPVRVRIYRPVDGAENLPGLLWMHGGGFQLGLPEMDDEFCRTVSAAARCVVVSVDYRLAPEHPFPAGLEDCYEALLWLSGGASELRVNPALVAIGGASAGGGLAAGLALLTRDRGGPEVCFQFLKYPCLDDRHITPSSLEFTDPRCWNRDRSIRAWQLYLGGASRVTPYAAPARATDLSRLPPAYVYAAELDLLRDEVIEYAMRLMRAGVGTELRVVRGAFHGSEGRAPRATISRRNMDEFVSVITRALNPAGSPTH